MDNNTNRPKLGDKITVHAIWTKTKFWGNGYLTKWMRKPIQAKEGIYIGKRRVYDGETDFHEEGSVFMQSAYHDLWLVVFNERDNPAHVSPTDTSWIPF